MFCDDRATTTVAGTPPGTWGASRREASPHFGIDPTTQEKTLPCAKSHLELQVSPASAETAPPGSESGSEPSSPADSEVLDAESCKVSLFKAVEAWEAEACGGHVLVGGADADWSRSFSGGGLELGVSQRRASEAEPAELEAGRRRGPQQRTAPPVSRWAAPSPDLPTVGEFLAKSRREAETMRAHASAVLALFEPVGEDQRAPHMLPSTTRLWVPGWHTMQAVGPPLV